MNGDGNSSASESRVRVAGNRGGGAEPTRDEDAPGGDSGVVDIVGNGTPGYFARHFENVQAQHAEERAYLQGRIGELEASLEDTETESRLVYEQLKVIKE